MPINESGSAALVRLALDAAALRHQAIANNIANAGSEDYVPLRVNFEQQLGALQAMVAGGRAPDPQSVRGVEPYVEPEPAAGGSAVLIEQEMLKLTQNTLHYQALLRAMGRQSALINLALNDGRR